MTIRHRRMGPGLDVALCGARGLFIYANTQRFVTCEACKAKYQTLRETGRTVSWGGRWSGRRPAARVGGAP